MLILAAVAVSAALQAADIAFEKTADDLFMTGQYDRGLDLANRGLDALPPGDPRRPRYLLARARACIELQERDCALAALDEAQPIAERERDLAVLARVHRDRGFWTWRFNRDAAAALREYDESITDARKAKEWGMLVMSLHLSGGMLRQLNRPDDALKRYNEALPIAEREWGTAHIWKNIGDTYRSTGRPELAVEPYRKAAAEADRLDVIEVRWASRLGLAVVTHDEQYFRESLDLLEGQQSTVILEDLRPGVFAAQMAQGNPYAEYIDFLLGRNRGADAFLVAERERARVFLAALSATRHDVVSKEERASLASLKAAQAALRDPKLDDANRAKRVADVEAAENRLNELRLRLAVEQPSLAHARYPKLWTAPDVQTKLLRADEALLSFSVGPKQSVAFLITRDRMQTFALPSAKALDPLVRNAIDECRNPAMRTPKALDDLAKALKIDPIAAAIKEGHLIIVPDGILNDLPFEVLPVSGHPLIEKTAISYAPSASSLAFLRQSKESAHPVALVAVANPVIAGSARPAQRQFDLAHMNMLAPLPHTADEVKQVAALFGSDAHVLQGANATLAQLQRGGIAQSSILHFATHGLIDENRPERSGLLLTATKDDDGLLQVRDIYAMHLNADLVTLSACDTALGKNVTGEGIIGLTRAFFFAGARSVAASLWSVDDAATSRFMQRFYANIRDGQPIDVALQQTKIEFIRDGVSPFFWAPFVVSGNARSTVSVPHTSPVAIGIALLAVIAVYFVIVNVRRGDDATSRP